jgi:hypothetical protein
VPHIDFDVVVHSVFRSAVNLKPKGESLLFTLLVSGETDLPQGIRLDTPTGFSFEELPVGILGICQSGILSLESFSLTMDLRNANRWDSNLLTLRANMNNPSVIAAWQSAWQTLNDQQVNSGSGLIAEDLFYPSSKKQSALVQRINESLHSILKATRQCNLADDNGIGALIGLGTGLTPSGDDLLTGYMAGLWCTSKGRSERLNFLSNLGEVVIRLAKGTNDISRTYLYHAARGQVSSRLFNLADAICTGSDPQQVRDCARSAMRAGHTSGMDTVTGLLFGLAAWDLLPFMTSVVPI